MIDVSIIKPKRIYNTNLAYITPNNITLDFGISSILFNYNTGYPNCIIDQKSLFDNNMDNATTKFDKFIEQIEIKDIWNECSINANDLTVFSAISGSGEDEFFIGGLELSNSLKLVCYGFTYFTKYISPKVIQKGFNCYLDYNSIYYLFQLFKHLSGKKLDKLLWQALDDKFIFTNDNKSFYIIVSQSDNILNFKINSLKFFVNFYDKVTINKTQVIKKNIAENLNSIGKHLIRTCNDIVDFSECNEYNKFEGDNIVLCLNK